MTKRDFSYFIDTGSAPRIAHAPGVETTILTGHNGEGMMMVLTELSPGSNVPAHSHPTNRWGWYMPAKLRCVSETKSGLSRKAIFVSCRPISSMRQPVSATSPLSCSIYSILPGKILLKKLKVEPLFSCGFPVSSRDPCIARWFN